MNNAIETHVHLFRHCQRPVVVQTHGPDTAHSIAWCKASLACSHPENRRPDIVQADTTFNAPAGPTVNTPNSPTFDAPAGPAAEETEITQDSCDIDVILYNILGKLALRHYTASTEQIFEENVQYRMRHADFWVRNSAEASSRTFVDLVLFDILERYQEEFAARHLCLIGEHPLSAQSLSDQRVSGIAHYVLGYEPPVRTLPRSFEIFAIIVEAKKESLGPRLGQIVAMISDGIFWRFLRLDGKILRVSDVFNAVSNYGHRHVYLYIDRIIRASIESSPHTSYSKNFPATQELWRERVEANIFKAFASTSQQTQNRLSGERPAAGGPPDFEEYEIQRSGPDVTLIPKGPPTQG
ncbi:hypothetical protein AJ80_03186 [Polytolypa hystricis UAMH7299]|uniref:Uncharacterized protein n=1 Tax=Polytolypa hystricis (strain UAMH7299) TaxID=1447883 RepID=A0A2B7YKZ9_POLH7|nr:hypothetical protein AJ80_03186 [Polytolypa hystricis UAMH7299]